MKTTVIKNIPGKEIPSHWKEKIDESLEQNFTIIIRPEGRHPKIQKDASSFHRRNHVLKILEGTTGSESSEEWISLIKEARTNSPLKTEFE